MSLHVLGVGTQKLLAGLLVLDVEVHHRVQHFPSRYLKSLSIDFPSKTKSTKLYDIVNFDHIFLHADVKHGVQHVPEVLKILVDDVHESVDDKKII